MKRSLLILLLCMGITVAAETTQKALIITHNGLKLRATPSFSGREVATIPFLDTIVVYDSTKANETYTFKEQLYYEDTKRYSKVQSNQGAKPIVIEDKYGFWRKATWQGRSGWLYDAMILPLPKRKIINLHYLYYLPRSFAKYEMPDSTADVTTTPLSEFSAAYCSDGDDSFGFELFGNRSFRAPHLVFSGQDYFGYNINSVNCKDGVYTIETTDLFDSTRTATYIIERVSKSRYIMNGNILLVPNHLHHETYVSDCEEYH